MGLDSLLDIAFERGCGVSRYDALCDQRYADIRKTITHVPHVQDNEAAEMIYLGELLAETAFRGLPRPIRQDAKAWKSYSPAERTACLMRLFKTLNARNWHVVRDVAITDPPASLEEGMPFARGSWSNGPVRPNCLGLAQALMGYARHTGARYYLVDTLVQYDVVNEEFAYRTLSELQEVVRDAAAFHGQRLLVSKLEDTRRKYLRSLADKDDERQAHHALMIEIDGVWRIVDPYLQRIYTLPAVFSRSFTKRHAKMLHAPRYSFIAWAHPKKDMYRSMDTKKAVKKILELLQQDPAPASHAQFMELISQVLPHFYLMQYGMPEGKVDEHKAKQLFEWLILYATFTIRERQAYIRQQPYDEEKPMRRMRLIMSQKRELQRALGRLIIGVIAEYIDLTIDAFYGKSSHHPLLEIFHPDYHLAVMTLNHAAHHTNSPSADLLRFTNSQWILHDTVKEVTEGSDRRLQYILRLRLRKSKKHPSDMIMPALRHYMTEC